MPGHQHLNSRVEYLGGASHRTEIKSSVVGMEGYRADNLTQAPHDLSCDWLNLPD